MLLGDVEFPGYVFNAPGARGFVGESYPLPHPGRLANWSGSTFVAKTVTLLPRPGNMPLCADGLTPQERIPRCIVADPIGKHAINCVGLSNAGLKAIIELDEWQERDEPFVVSFMAMGKTMRDRMDEWFEIFTVMLKLRSSSRSKFVLKVNIACPNTGHDILELLDEVQKILDMSQPFGLRLIIGINLLVPAKAAADISRHPACLAVLQCNSIPWGEFPDRIPWKKLFGSDVSPLVARGFGPGGYSGPYALPILVDWICKARYARSGARWLIAGGGIQSVADAEQVMRVGYPILTAIMLGVISMFRPWEVQPIIKSANAHFGSIDKRRLHHAV